MHDENTLYLECRSGISGDMTVAALLDLGATEEHLREELRKLPVDGYEIQVKKVVKSGLQVSDFDVILEHEAPAHTHDHMHTHVHRSWADIEKMLLESDLKPRVKALSLQMFLRHPDQPRLRPELPLPLRCFRPRKVPLNGTYSPRSTASTPRILHPGRRGLPPRPQHFRR